MQVRRFVFATMCAGLLASVPVQGGFTLALETPRAAVEIAPLVAAQLQYEAIAPGENAPRPEPSGFEKWAFNQHRAARDGLARPPLGPTCAVSGFGNAPR